MLSCMYTLLQQVFNTGNSRFLSSPHSSKWLRFLKISHVFCSHYGFYEVGHMEISRLLSCFRIIQPGLQYRP